MKDDVNYFIGWLSILSYPLLIYSFLLSGGVGGQAGIFMDGISGEIGVIIYSFFVFACGRFVFISERWSGCRWLRKERISLFFLLTIILFTTSAIIYNRIRPKNDDPFEVAILGQYYDQNVRRYLKLSQKKGDKEKRFGVVKKRYLSVYNKLKEKEFKDRFLRSISGVLKKDEIKRLNQIFRDVKNKDLLWYDLTDEFFLAHKSCVYSDYSFEDKVIKLGRKLTHISYGEFLKFYNTINPRVINSTQEKMLQKRLRSIYERVVKCEIYINLQKYSLYSKLYKNRDFVKIIKIFKRRFFLEVQYAYVSSARLDSE